MIRVCVGKSWNIIYIGIDMDYRIFEEDGYFDLQEKINKYAGRGWTVCGYAVRSTSMRDYYSAIMQKAKP